MPRCLAIQIEVGRKILQHDLGGAEGSSPGGAGTTSRNHRAVPQRFPVWFPGAPQIGVSDVGERDQLDGVQLDQARAGAHRVPAAGLYLGPFPQPERQGDLPGQHVISQVLAEEHALRLRPTHLGAKRDLGVPAFHFHGSAGAEVDWGALPGRRRPGSTIHARRPLS